MTTKEVLIAAKEKLQQGTCKGWFARTAGGTECSPHAPQAVAWCPAGAIRYVLDPTPDFDMQYIVAVDVLAAFAPDGSDSVGPCWDRPEITEAELFAWLDRAIEAVE